jgi:sucrose-6-phosphate hydrolase SacC (GH32 family)
MTHRPNQQANAVEKADDKTLVQMAIVYKIKPYAWWTFEKGKETDLTGRFLFNHLDGGAKIEGGRLILTQNGELFVPKSLFDGKRRLIWGWIRDVEGNRDNGKPQWGGTLSLPREILPGPVGQLYSRPAAEITAAFTETVLDLTSKPMPDNTTGTWNYADGKLVSGPDGGACRFNVPDDYMMQATFKLDPAATLTIKMRQQKEDNAGYPLVISPKKQEVTISRAQNRFGRTIELDAAQPITVQAFVQGAILECFINGKEAFTCRAYDYSTGGLSLEAAGGQMTILGLTVQTLPQKAARKDLAPRRRPT